MSLGSCLWTIPSTTTDVALGFLAAENIYVPDSVRFARHLRAHLRLGPRYVYATLGP